MRGQTEPRFSPVLCPVHLLYGSLCRSRQLCIHRQRQVISSNNKKTLNPLYAICPTMPFEHSKDRFF